MTLPHSSAKFKQIAEDNTILLTQIGSGLHGVTTGTDDRDEMGVCIEPPDYVIGNAAFEQYLYRTQPEGVRSGPGDLDKTVYSLRKWARLAAQGNPTAVLLLYAPEHEIVIRHPPGADLQANAELFLSRETAHRFAGYLISQRNQLLGLKSKKHTNRPELIDEHGFDTKFAYHMVRLGIQGVELVTTGRIILPIPEPTRTWLTRLRHGHHTQNEAIEYAELLLTQLEFLGRHADLPEKTDQHAINTWLQKTYLEWWEQHGHL